MMPFGCSRSVWLSQLTNLKSLEYNAGDIVDKNVFLLTRLEKLKLFAGSFGEINQLSGFDKLTSLELGSGDEDATIELTCKLHQIRNLSIRYLPGINEAFLSNFPNITTLKIRRTFVLPPKMEQLKKLSLGSMEITGEDLSILSRLTNLVSLVMHGNGLGSALLNGNCYLPTTLRSLSLEEFDSFSENVLPCLTKLVNLTNLDLAGYNIRQEDVQEFVKVIPQLQCICFRGIDSNSITFQHKQSWRNFLRQHKLYVDVKVSNI